MTTKEAIERLILGGIEADIDETIRRHKTGPNRTPWSKKGIGGRRTRGMTSEQWAAHCKSMSQSERGGDRNPDKKRVTYTEGVYSRSDLSLRCLAKHR